MIHDSPFSAIEGEFEICWFMQEIEPSWNALHYPDIFIRRSGNNKSSKFTNPSLPQIEMINIGHKAYLLL